MNKKIPKVVIVGKPNVGKSTFFNRVVQKRISITSEISGVTRDRIYHICEWLKNKFYLIDTGGILKNLNIDFQSEINIQVELAIKEADIIIFLVSGKEGITKEDLYVSSQLKKIKNKKIILASNKIDNKELESNIYEFVKLGFGIPISISSIHGIGISNLLDTIVEEIKSLNLNLSNDYEATRIGIIGKPNVGKSTLLNNILKENRVIISDIPGTTRDSIDTFFTLNENKYILTDTAGIKRNKNSLNEIEFYSELRSNLTAMNSDLIILLLDYKSGISFIDEKIMGQLKDNLKPCLIFVNKKDELQKENLNIIKEEIKNKFKFSPWIEIDFISAKNKTNFDFIFQKIEEIKINLKQKISISDLNEFLIDIQMIKKPPRFNGINVKLSYISYFYDGFPHFIIFSNHPNKIHFTYKRFIENQIRKIFEFKNIPLKISFRKK